MHIKVITSIQILEKEIRFSWILRIMNHGIKLVIAAMGIMIIAVEINVPIANPKLLKIFSLIINDRSTD